jgi:hypothetical protein
MGKGPCSRRKKGLNPPQTVQTIPPTALMPANLVIYLVRHAEKPDEGSDLLPAGQAPATAYVNYFQNLKEHTSVDRQR